MLNGINLIDFGNHRETRMTFGSMNGLVGQNGSGKTNVMRAIDIVSRAREGVKINVGDWERYGAWDLTIAASWCSAGKLADSGVILTDTGPPYWLFRLRPSGETSPWVPPLDLDMTSVVNATHAQNPNDLNVLASKHSAGTVFHCAKAASKWRSRYFKASARQLQSASYSENENPELDDDGSNLAWALAYLMTAKPDSFAEIMGALRQVVPVIRRVRARPCQIKRIITRTITVGGRDRSIDEEQVVMGQELLFDMASGSGLPASAVSEGTLVVLALLTLIHGGTKVNTVMLDDVELGLHPRAQRDLVKQLRNVQENNKNLQLILSTHSPYIVDELGLDEVWILTPDHGGCAVTRRLGEHPDAKRALEVLTTGEFWSAEGEAWVLNEPKPGE